MDTIKTNEQQGGKMSKIGAGIKVYYVGEKNKVFFADGSWKWYTVGGLLFEMISDEAYSLTVEKSKRMIRCFPGYQMDITVSSVTDAFRWLYEVVEDESLPVATELFRSLFSKIIKCSLADEDIIMSCKNVGDLMDKCYERYYEHMEMFSIYVSALVASNSQKADRMAVEFYQIADRWRLAYQRDCKVKEKKTEVIFETSSIVTPIELLIFEYWRMYKTKRILKECENCGRFFIPKGRNDTIYCFKPSLQDPEKTCSEIGAQERRKRKRESDPTEQDYHRNYSRQNMNAKRARDRGEDYLPYLKKEQAIVEQHENLKKERGGSSKMSDSEVREFIEEMELLGDVWTEKEVREVYGKNSLSEALEDRRALFQIFANNMKVIRMIKE